MTEIAERIDVVVQGIAPALKAAGYRKTGRTWRRQDAESISVTNLQASWTNLGQEGRFTLNLGVYFPGPEVLKNGPPPKPTPSQADCIVNERIGHLMPVGNDYWWEIDRNTDLGELSNAVASSWQRFGSPWLDALRDPAAAQRWLLHHRKFVYWAAVFALYRGEREEAASLLERALAELPKKHQLARWHREWGVKHGLLS